MYVVFCFKQGDTNCDQLGYIELLPMTSEELLKALQNLNTLLSIRLNLHEYDRIPPQFKDFTIKSGRVTFRVPGEFEVDLTIADENPESQFWFIDFRFLFSPALSQLPDSLRYMIENRVNFTLEKDGLVGCYKCLHELVLTHKISELRRQAVELSRGRWIDTLQVEPLHRALSIQYWVDRYGKDGPKSWVIIGVHSGRRVDGRPNYNATSYISIRWFRDSKEVKDHKLELELTELSAESLLQSVISRHISYILESTYSILRTKSLFSSRELSISFQTAGTEPKEPELKVQLTRHDEILIIIEPITGRFAISPPSRLATQAESKLNNQTRDLATNAHEFIENLRCVTVSEEVISRALTVGWQLIRNPGLKQEELKPIVPRDTLQLSWFRMAGWGQEWVVVLSSGMSGERWWLIEM
jgi:mediator of RNA polymerase II transcription subunit 14